MQNSWDVPIKLPITNTNNTLTSNEAIQVENNCKKLLDFPINLITSEFLLASELRDCNAFIYSIANDIGEQSKRARARGRLKKSI